MQRLFLALTAVVIIAIAWSWQEKAPQEPVAKLIIPNNIDYYLKNTHQVSFKKNGSIDLTLDSSLIEHFKHEDISVLQQPDMLMQRQNTWRIQALKGEYLHPQEIMMFNTNVTIHKKSDDDSFNVFANDLLFNIQQDLVISNSGVTVESGSWQLKAGSMSLDMNNEIHQFNTVKASYRNDKKS